MRMCMLVLTTVACGSAATGPQLPAPIDEVARAPVDAAVNVTTADAAPDAGIDAATAAAPPGPPVIAAACRGEQLVLSTAKECIVAAEAPDALPPGIVARIAPTPLRLRRDRASTIAIVLTNTTAADATLLLDCRHLGWDRYTMFDKRGHRVDVRGECSPGGGGCGGPTYGFALPPGGQARYELEIETRIEDACGGERQGAVPRGTYELRVYSGLAGELRVPVRID